MSTCQGKLAGRLIVTTGKQSSRTAHCDAGVTQNLPTLPKLTWLTLHGGSARDSRDVTAAMTHVIHRVLVTYVTTISSIRFIALSLLAALLFLYEAAQLLKFLGVELLAFDEAHE